MERAGDEGSRPTPYGGRTKSFSDVRVLGMLAAVLETRLTKEDLWTSFALNRSTSGDSKRLSPAPRRGEKGEMRCRRRQTTIGGRPNGKGAPKRQRSLQGQILPNQSRGTKMNELKLELEALEDRIAPCAYSGDGGDNYGSGDTYQSNYNDNTYQYNNQDGTANVNVQVDDTNVVLAGNGDAINNDDGTVNNDSAVAGDGGAAINDSEYAAANSGDGGAAAAAEDYAVANSGDGGAAAAAGEYAAANSGDYGAAAAGENAEAVTSGGVNDTEDSVVATTGGLNVL